MAKSDKQPRYAMAPLPKLKDAIALPPDLSLYGHGMTRTAMDVYFALCMQNNLHPGPPSFDETELARLMPSRQPGTVRAVRRGLKVLLAAGLIWPTAEAPS